MNPAPSPPPPPASSLDYSRLYAKYHGESPEHRRGVTLLNLRILGPHLPADRSSPILDVGCGRGYALQDLATLGYTALSGIETDAGQAAYARAHGADVTVVSDTARFLSDRPDTYAVILLMDVLEHVPREAQPGLLRGLARSLCPGGKLICSVPNAASAIQSFWLHNDYTHQWSFTAVSLEFLLEECGFSAVRCTGVEVTPRPRFLFWLPIPRTIAWWLRCAVRGRLRITYVAELGWATGWRIPLTPNLLALAVRE